MNIIATRLEDFAVSGIIDGIFFFFFGAHYLP